MNNVKINAQGKIDMKDVELREAFKTQLDGGLPFVVAVTTPKQAADGKHYFQLSIVQQKVSNAKVDELDKLLLGWGKQITIERTFRNVALEEIDQATADTFCVVGNELVGCNVEVHHSIVKPYENAKPINIIDKEGKLVYLTANAGQETEEVTFNKVKYASETTKGGELVYKHTRVVMGEAKDFKLALTRTLESEFKGVSAILNSGELEQAN